MLLVPALAPAQTLEWVHTIGGIAPASDRCYSSALAVEGGTTFVYTVGFLGGVLDGALQASGGGRAFVAKHDLAGNRIWATQFGTSRATAVAVDGHGVWVAGSTTGTFLGESVPGPNLSGFLARFDAGSGALLGGNLFGTARTDEVSGVDVDAHGVTIVGWTDGDFAEDPGLADGSYDAFVRRYTFGGASGLGAQHAWTKQIAGPEQQVGAAVTHGSLAGTDYLFVAYEGYAYEANYGSGRCFVARMPLVAQPNGAPPEPVTRLLPRMSLHDVPHAVAFDGTSLYVSGGAYPSGGFLTKLAPGSLEGVWSGPRVMTSLNNGNARTLVAVHQGGVYTCGGNWTSPNVRIIVSSHDPASGVVLASRSAGYVSDNYPMGFSAGDAGLVVGGYGYGSFRGTPEPSPNLQDDVFVLRFDAALTLPAPTVIAEFGTTRATAEQASAIDGNGNVYVAGQTSGILPNQATMGRNDAFVVELDPSGQRVATWQFGSSGDDAATGVAVDATGIYVVGTTTGVLPDSVAVAGMGTLPANYGYPLFLRKIPFAGQTGWTRTLGVAGSAVALSVVGGDIYVAGTTYLTFPGQPRYAPTNSEDAYVARLGTDGSFAWVRQMGTGEGMIVRDACADATGAYFVGDLWQSAWPGEQHSPYTSANGYVVKVAREDGSPVWYDQLSSFGPNSLFAVAAHAGRVFLGGGGNARSIDPTILVDGYAPVVRCYDATSAAVIWTRVVTGSTGANNTAVCYALDADAKGVYVGGNTRGAFPGFTNAGRYDGFAVQYTPLGDRLWTLQFGSANEDLIEGITSTANSVYLAGYGYAGSDAMVARISLDAPPVAVSVPSLAAHCGIPVALDGRGSYDDNTPANALLFAWTFVSKPAGSNAVLLGADQSLAGFVPDMTGNYEVRLVVYDTLGQSGSCLVMISSSNQAPLADAGRADLTYIGQPVILNGTASSDPDADPLTYQWSIVSAPAGSSPSLDGATTPQPTFRAYAAGDYVISLVVSDLCMSSAPATVAIRVITSTDYAVGKLIVARTLLNGLLVSQVSSGGNQNSLDVFLRNAITDLDKGKPDQARGKIVDAMARTDGYPLRNALDGNGPGMDWILDETAQRTTYATLLAALEALTP